MIRNLLAKLIRRHYRGIPDHALHGSASEPAEPVVASMPRQRTCSPMEVTPDEVDALIRVVACRHLGRDWRFEDYLTIQAMHERAKRQGARR